MHPSTLKQRRSESSDEDDSVSSMVYLFLPEHVWKLILQNIKSTKELLKLRTASKLFCTMINDQLNSERRWEKLCYSRRITPWHAALKNTLFASNENNSLDEFVADQSNWKIMYFSYRKWESINKSQKSFRITVTNSVPNNTTITFIAKTAEGVIMVINERYIVVNFLVDFNISDTQIINLPLSRRGSIVREVGFWNVEKTIIIYAKLEDRSICFWKAGSPRHISYHTRSLGNIFCTDNDVLMNVNDNITRLAKYHYDHQSGSVSRQLVNIIRQPNDINLEEFQIIGLFGNANSITVACRKEKTILKLKIKIPESTTLQYIIYERTLYDLEISDVRKPYICYIPLSDVVLIANAEHLWMLTRTEVFNRVERNFSEVRCESTITSLEMYCNTIIVGLDNGSIHFFQLYDYQDNPKISDGYVMGFEISDNESIGYLKAYRMRDQDRIFIGMKYSLKFFKI